MWKIFLVLLLSPIIALADNPPIKEPPKKETITDKFLKHLPITTKSFCIDDYKAVRRCIFGSYFCNITICADEQRCLQNGTDAACVDLSNTCLGPHTIKKCLHDSCWIETCDKNSNVQGETLETFDLKTCAGPYVSNSTATNNALTKTKCYDTKNIGCSNINQIKKAITLGENQTIDLIESCPKSMPLCKETGDKKYECVKEKIVCVDNDNSDYQKLKYWKANEWRSLSKNMYSILKPSSVEYIPEEKDTTHLYFWDKCKDNLYLDEQVCYDGQPKSITVSCQLKKSDGQELGGKCSSIEQIDDKGNKVELGYCDVDLSSLPDKDADIVPDIIDNCLDVANSDQKNSDGDEFGDACEGPCINFPGSTKLINSKKDPLSDPTCKKYQKFLPTGMWMSSEQQFSDYDCYGLPELIASCKTLTSCYLDIPLPSGTKQEKEVSDQDKINDDQELYWQAKELKAFDGTFHPEYGETNPLNSDTDGDGLNDDVDFCPLNNGLSCDPASCHAAENFPSSDECKTELIYEYSDSTLTQNKISSLDIVWPDGSKIIGAVHSKEEIIFMSDNEGVDWSIKKIINSKNELFTWNFNPISISNDGKKIRISYTDGTNYFSDDGGKIWQALDLAYSKEITFNSISGNGLLDLAFGPFNGDFFIKINDEYWKQISVGPLPVYEAAFFMDSTGKHLIFVGAIFNDISGLKPYFETINVYDKYLIENRGFLINRTGSLALVYSPDSTTEDAKDHVDVSNDYGKTWIDISEQVPNGITRIAMQPDADVIAAITENGSIWKTLSINPIDKQWQPLKLSPPLPNNLGTWHLAISPSGKEMVAMRIFNINDPTLKIYKIFCPSL